MIELKTTLFGTTSLGALVDALAPIKPDANVWFDFGHTVPTDLHSYRGLYDHLAVGWAYIDDMPEVPTVEAVSRVLDDADGREFVGYKGGSYRMDRDTPVWVDRPGDASGTAIVGIDRLYDDGIVFIITRHVDA